MFKTFFILKTEFCSFLFLLFPVFTLFYFQPHILLNIDTPRFQLLALFLVIFINWLAFKVAHRLMKKVSNHYYLFNLILTVSCFALAGFSQDELRQFGFIMSNNSEGMFYYFIYKTIFNLIAFYNASIALQFFIKREKLTDFIKKTNK